jgi:hypothetical protein
MSVAIGSVLRISHNGMVKHWKVTGVPRVFLGSPSYPVVKCTKLGSEYRITNGWCARFIDTEIAKSDGAVKLERIVPVGMKANLDGGIESGKKKRRIAFLKAKIEQYQKELKELEAGHAGN